MSPPPLRFLHVLIEPENAAALPEPVRKANRHRKGIATDPSPASYATKYECYVGKGGSGGGSSHTSVHGEVTCSQPHRSE